MSRPDTVTLARPGFGRGSRPAAREAARRRPLSHHQQRPDQVSCGCGAARPASVFGICIVCFCSAWNLPLQFYSVRKSSPEFRISGDNERCLWCLLSGRRIIEIVLAFHIQRNGTMMGIFLPLSEIR